MTGHDGVEGRLVERPDRRQPLGDELAMAAVRAEDQVPWPQPERGADGHAFLPDGKVGRPLVGKGNAAIGAGRLEGAQHRLEFADDQHVAKHILQHRRAVGGKLVRKRGRIGMKGNGREFQFARLQNDGRVNQKLLGHGSSRIIQGRVLYGTFV